MMNEISLRSYIREIEGLINRNQNEEAIAHCRNILKSYPRYIDAYRILGKALLESQRFGDATDIFQRVLSSIPDDFISHVGMSLVREDEGNLNEAIWHMERAFEIQPANSTIQDELRRLYGRRDGVEPLKIRLTRGALARMYDKGDLYQQAITELRATLAEDPGRYDLRTLLATIYLKTGQKVEAAETANHILRNLPNCFVAIKIMIQVLSESDREAEAKNLFEKLNQLDPYSQFASPKSPSSENVSENAIIIEKLDWKREKYDIPESQKPDWATSIGIDTGEISTEESETIPDWITELSPSEEDKPEIEDKEMDEEVPEWLLELEDSEEELEIKEVGEEITATSEEGLPDWLQDFEELEEKPDVVEAEQEITEAPEEELPDWLQEIGTTEEEEEIVEPTPQAKLVAEEPEEALPDWLQEIEAPDEEETEIEEVEEEITATPEEGLPDWLQDFEELEEKPDVIQAEQEITKAPEEELPDWLQDFEAAEEEPEIVETDQKISATPAEELPDWLKEMEEEQEPILGDTQPTQFSDQPVLEPFVDEISFEPLEDADKEVDILESESQEKYYDQKATSQKSDQEKTEKEEIDAAYAWLESLAVKRGAQEGLLLSPEERSETPPDWIKDSVENLEEDLLENIQDIDSKSKVPDFNEIGEEIEEETFFEEYDDEMESIASAIVTAELRSLEIQQEEVKEEIPEERITEQKKTLLESEVDEDSILMIGEEKETEIELDEIAVDSPVEEELKDTIFEEQTPSVESDSDKEMPEFPSWLDEEKFEEEIPFQKKPDLQTETIPILEEKPIGGRIVNDEHIPTEILEARQSMYDADFERGIIQYAGLIKNNLFLDLIVQDLEGLSQTYTNEIGVWQNLGDAYLRINQVNDALQAYIKAEKLLD